MRSIDRAVRSRPCKLAGSRVLYMAPASLDYPRRYGGRDHERLRVIRHGLKKISRQAVAARRCSRLAAVQAKLDALARRARSNRLGVVLGPLLAVAAVTAAIYAFREFTPVLSLGVLYLFAVLPVAVIWGRVAAVVGGGGQHAGLQLVPSCRPSTRSR